MNPSDNYHRQYQQHRKVIQRLLRKPAALYSEEDFHRFRVELKKTDAIFQLLDQCDPKFKGKKHIAAFTKCYSRAGKVRELQLVMHNIDYYDHAELSAYLIPLFQFRLDQAKEKYFKSAMKLRKQVPELSEKYFKAINAIAVQKFLDKKQHQADALMQLKIPSGNDLHLLRKKLKTASHIRRMEKGKTPMHSGSEELMKLLGLWHDMDVFTDDMEAILNAGEHTDDIHWLLFEMVRSLNHELLKLRHKISDLKSQTESES